MSVIQPAGPILMGFGLFGMTWLAPQQQVSGDYAGEHLGLQRRSSSSVVPRRRDPRLHLAADASSAPAPGSSSISSPTPNTWYMTILYVMTSACSPASPAARPSIDNQFGRESTVASAGAEPWCHLRLPGPHRPR